MPLPRPSPNRATPVRALDLRLRAAVRLGWRVDCIDPETGWLWRLRRGDRTQHLIGMISPLNDAVATRLASDKFYTARVLAEAGFLVPEGVRALDPRQFAPAPGDGDPFAEHRGLAAAQALARRAGYPLVVKPNRGSCGRQVVVVEDGQQLGAAVEAIWASEPLAVIERPLAGIDLRMDLLDGELLLAYLRRPLRLRGDGRSTVLELLHAADRRAGRARFVAQLSAEPLWRETLAAAELGEHDRLPAGHTLEFPATILNLNRCCSAEVFAELPAPWVAFAGRVASCLGLRHCGIDLRVAADDEPLAADPVASTIIEVNASPLVRQVAELGELALAEAAEERVVAALGE